MQGHNRIRVTEAAEILEVSRKTVHNWINRGFLPAIRAGVGCIWLIEKADVEGLLKQGVIIPEGRALNGGR